MQPDTATNTQIKIGDPPGKQKENLAPIEQWDQLAFTLMFQQLAPKGFKKFQNGHWKGADHADIPFLPKKTVIQCQKIAAQLVRGFREKAKQQIKERLKRYTSDYESWTKILSERKFWQITQKRNFKLIIRSLKAKIGTCNILLSELDNIPIK